MLCKNINKYKNIKICYLLKLTEINFNSELIYIIKLMSNVKKVGEYTLKEKIGVGSFGTVYRAIKKCKYV